MCWNNFVKKCEKVLFVKILLVIGCSEVIVEMLKIGTRLGQNWDKIGTDFQIYFVYSYIYRAMRVRVCARKYLLSYYFVINKYVN